MDFEISDIRKTILNELFLNQDLKYRDFQSSLMPGVDKKSVIGVRMPVLRKLGAKYAHNPDISYFLNELPHEYYEENNLHGIIIEKIEDFDICCGELEKFLPYVDNWATCDLISPKCFAANRERVLKLIENWIKSEKTFTVRFAIEMLMKYFLGDNFDKKYPEMVAAVKAEEYYVKMMIAWYFATALTFNYHQSIPFIEKKILDKWTHNKAIQKSLESYRISSERKEYLRKLKIK